MEHTSRDTSPKEKEILQNLATFTVSDSSNRDVFNGSGPIGTLKDLELWRRRSSGL